MKLLEEKMTGLTGRQVLSIFMQTNTVHVFRFMKHRFVQSSS